MPSESHSECCHHEGDKPEADVQQAVKVSRCPIDKRVREGMVRLWLAISHHPWWTAIFVGSSVVMCPVCKYSTGVILIVGVLLGLRQPKHSVDHSASGDAK